VQLEGLGQFKNPVTSGFEPVAFLLVAQCLNQLHYHVPPLDTITAYLKPHFPITSSQAHLVSPQASLIFFFNFQAIRHMKHTCHMGLRTTGVLMEEGNDH
jgi:hypothetical protein